MEKSESKKTRILFIGIFLLITLIIVNIYINMFLKIQPVSKSISDEIVQLVTVNGDEKTILGTVKGQIVCLDKDQNIVWENNLGVEILSLSYFNDKIIIGSEDRKLRIFSLEGKEIGNVSIDYRPIKIVASKEYIYVGNTISVTRNQIMKLDYELKIVNTIKVDNPVLSLFISEDNNKLIAVFDAAQIEIYNSNLEPMQSYESNYNLISAAYSPASKSLYVCDNSNKIYKFSEDLKEIWSYKSKSTITSLHFNQKSDLLLGATNNGEIFSINNVGKQEFKFDAIPSIYEIIGSADANNLYIINTSNTMYIYNIEQLKNIKTYDTIGTITFILLIVCIIWFLFVLLSLLFKNFHRESIATVLKVGKALFKSRYSYLMLAPTLILIIVFCYYPAIEGFLLAFFDYKPGIRLKFIGLDNFIQLIANSYFWTGFGNMFLFLLTDLLKCLIPPLIIAELIIAMRSSKLQYLTRVLLYLPGVIPGVAALLIWTSGIFSMNGLINGVLGFLNLGGYSQAWLGNEKTAIWALIFMGFPFIGSYIIYYGALIGIPKSFYEAAKLDGCTWIKRIIFIDIKMISPQMKYVFVVSFIGSIQDFGRVFLTTMGGPGHSTYTPMLELYFNMTKFQNYGGAAAMGLILFIFVFAITLINLKVKTDGSYE